MTILESIGLTGSEAVTVIFIAIMFILVIPWYVKQLGRFFCQGAIERCFEMTKVMRVDFDTLMKLSKEDKNGEKA